MLTAATTAPIGILELAKLQKQRDYARHATKARATQTITLVPAKQPVAAAAATDNEDPQRAALAVVTPPPPTTTRNALTASYVGLSALFDACIADVEHRYADTLQTCTPGPLWMTISDSRYRMRRHEGDVVLLRTRRALEAIGHTRTFIQKRFHEMMHNVCAPIMYDVEWQTQREAVMQRNSWFNHPPLCAALWPRRNGKTTACSDGVTGYILSVPGIDVVTFAPTLRQSKQIMDQIRASIKAHPEFKNFEVVTDQSECLKIRGPDGTVRTITALPSTHKVTSEGVRCEALSVTGKKRYATVVTKVEGVFILCFPYRGGAELGRPT